MGVEQAYGVIGGAAALIRAHLYSRAVPVLEAGLEEMLRLLENRPEPVPLFSPPARLGASWWKLDPETAREPIDGFGKLEMFELHDELEDIAALVAP